MGNGSPAHVAGSFTSDRSASRLLANRDPLQTDPDLESPERCVILLVGHLLRKEVPMSKSDSEGENNPLRAEGPFTSFFRLDAHSSVPTEFRCPSTFTITRLRSPVGLPDRITKRSAAPALLVSVSLAALPKSDYQLWTEDKLIPTTAVDPFRSNVIDFASGPRCWTGCAFDYLHYSVPREGLEDIARDLGFGNVKDYRLAVLEDDLVVAQITKSILPFVGRNDPPSVLALDQFSLILGAHLLQRYGVLQKVVRARKGGLAPWQMRRASELLHEKIHGRLRLSELARECGLSVSHFARSYKIAFGLSPHQWLIQHRIKRAKELMTGTRSSLMEIAIQSGFSDQAAFTRTFRQVLGVAPGNWRRQNGARHFDS